MDTTYSEPVGDVQQYEPDYHRVSDYLGVDKFARRDAKLAQKVSIVRQWARENAQDESLESEVATINSLRHKVGTQNLGETLINELYQHLRFQSDPHTKAKSLKKVSKGKPKSKGNPVKNVVNQAISSSIADIVKKQMGNKNVVYKLVNQAIIANFK